MTIQHVLSSLTTFTAFR